ncbi:hypothetical protein CDD83_10931 [Cordyceps sp. RAO-2017]|nr:hypothetical protein CDD83_10931 [Cordyceps sp. RAO-2017]
MGRAISPRRSLWALGTVLVLFVLLVLRREQLMAAGGPRPQYFLKAKPARAAIARPSPPGASPDTIQNSTLGFERIFVVSLPTRTDRRDAFALQAAVTDIHFEFVDGVRGSDMAENAIPKTEAGQHIADAELGCWRSHMNVMQE